MTSLAEGMEKIVRDIQSSTEQRKAKVSELRSDSHNLIERFGLEHGDMARTLKDKMNSDKKARTSGENARLEVAQQETGQRKAKVSELRSDFHNLVERFGLERRDMARALKGKLNSDKNAGIEKVKELRSELAADLRKARSIWLEAKKKLPEVKVAEAVGVMERVLDVIQARTEGIRLLEIGNELGVDWRSLTKVVKTLVDAGQVEKMDDVYYPSTERGEGI